MSLLFVAALALIALQFTSAIGQWVSESQKATETVQWLQWLVSKIGLAPTIITTRVFIIVVFALLYVLDQHWLVWAIFVVAAWYLYKTGKYVAIWAELKNDASAVIDNGEADVTKAVVTDVTKNLVVDPPQAPSAYTSATTAAASANAAAKGVDTSSFGS